MAKKIFIVGTSTDVGKTFVSALIVKKLRQSGANVAYYKPAMSGNQRDKQGNLIPGDALYVKETAFLEQPLQEMYSYAYETAVSPHLASKLEGRPIQLLELKQELQALSKEYDYITIEGAGGILCPIQAQPMVLLSDLIKCWDCACLLVADAGLGTLNMVGLTAFYMKKWNIAVKGIILNRFDPQSILHQDNKKMCEQMTQIPVVACVQENQTDLELSEKVLLSYYC